jgi:predicted metal-binding membrane protein
LYAQTSSGVDELLNASAAVLSNDVHRLQENNDHEKRYEGRTCAQARLPRPLPLRYDRRLAAPPRLARRRPALAGKAGGMNALIPVNVNRRSGAERPVVIGCLSALVALCWAYLLFRASRLGGDTAAMAGMGMAPPPPAPYRAPELLLLFGIWMAMISALMLPATTPAVVLFARVSRLYHAVRRPYLSTALFVLGYLCAWTLFSGAATLVQWALHDAGALDHAMAVTNSTVAGLSLVAAGVYQWTPAKQVCLQHCRTPLAFILTGWRRGPWGAFRMGATHGRYCIGCCWLLMVLLFAAGVMNLFAVAGLALLVLAEKLLPAGAWTATLAGLALVAWGTLLLFP